MPGTEALLDKHREMLSFVPAPPSAPQAYSQAAQQAHQLAGELAQERAQRQRLETLVQHLSAAAAPGPTSCL